LASTASTAQSGDASYPTPVFTNEVVGRISPRDVGDPRRTSHFYTFRGTEGDLSVTFDSTELTGDVDVFTATTLRPLLKITLLGDAAHVTKSFYVRSEETLVLRVQARAVGDAEGTYRVTFGGSFEPAPPELANSQEPSAPTVKESGSRDRNARRATSTGARIEEPVAAPSKETAKEEAKPSPTPAATPSRRTTSSAARSRAGTRNAPRRTRSTASTPRAGATKSETGEAKNAGTSGESNNGEAKSSSQPSTETNGATNTTESAAATPPKPSTATRRRPARTTRRSAGESGTARADSSGQPSNAPATSEPLPKQRLLIITKNGTMIERDMDTVRRVTVENNQVVVVTKDGKIIREPLANVLKMSIEP
jgi:hypothetical protein